MNFLIFWITAWVITTVITIVLTTILMRHEVPGVTVDDSGFLILMSIFFWPATLFYVVFFSVKVYRERSKL